MDKMNFINTFFMRFSYTFKTKFIFVLGNLPIFCFFALLYFFLYLPVTQIQNQLKGASFLQQTSEIFETIIAKILEEKSRNSSDTIKLNSLVDSKFMQLKAQIILDRQDYENKKLESAEQLKMDCQIFQEMWNYIQSHNSTNPQNFPSTHDLEGLINAYYHLITDAAYSFEMTETQPPILKGLVYLITQDIPNLQIDILQNFGHFDKKMKSTIKDWTPLKNSEQILKLISLLFPNPEFAELIKKIEALSKSLDSYSHNESLDAPQSLNTPIKNLLNLTSTLSQSLIVIYQQSLEKENEALKRMLWLSLLSFITGELSVSMIFFNRELRHPLSEIVKGAQMLAKGNLSVRIPVKTKDELAELTTAYNSLADYYEKILKKATDIIVKIFQGSSKIADLATIIESNMNVQEQMINQIATHSQVIQDKAKEYAQVIDNVNKEASGTHIMVEQGHIHLHGMESVMQEMLNAVKNVFETLSSLQAKIVLINKVISSIVNIADQRNLLSLNTAIRAKKSGQEGRGFIIIADKIREMADQIAYATLDIEQSVKDILGFVEETVSDVEDFSSQILKQFEETRGVSNKLKQLIDSTQQQVKDFEKINEGMQFRNQQEEVINQAINNLEMNIQVTAFSVHKLHFEIECLYDASEHLHAKTKQFTFSE